MFMTDRGPGRKLPYLGLGMNRSTADDTNIDPDADGEETEVVWRADQKVTTTAAKFVIKVKAMPFDAHGLAKSTAGTSHWTCIAAC